MIDIYIPFKPGFFNFFLDYNNEFNKYGINFNYNLEKSNIVLYLFNLGVEKLFHDKNLNLRSKYDHGKEINNIKYFINLNKKIIIYIRQDGASFLKTINDLINKYKNSILFVMKDYLLKEEKYYKLIGNSHYKY